MASFLGIDLSKETFHACLLSDRADAKKVFPNTPKGFEQLTTCFSDFSDAYKKCACACVPYMRSAYLT